MKIFLLWDFCIPPKVFSNQQANKKEPDAYGGTLPKEGSWIQGAAECRFLTLKM